MTGKEIIELIKKHSLENEEIGMYETNDFGDILSKPIEGIIKINEYYHVCYFVDKEECKNMNEYKLS